MHVPLWKGNLDAVLFEFVPDREVQLALERAGTVRHVDRPGTKLKQERAFAEFLEYDGWRWIFQHVRVGGGDFQQEFLDEMRIAAVTDPDTDAKTHSRVDVRPVDNTTGDKF